MLILQVAMRPDASHFIILLRLMPEDFIRQEESAATQWVKRLGLLDSVWLKPINAQYVSPDK
jgi:hypothetical protein